MATPINLSAVRGFFGGSGMDLFGEQGPVDRLLEMTGKFNPGTQSLTEPVTVVYIGTPAYDIPSSRNTFVEKFAHRSCRILSVSVADPCVESCSAADLAALDSADVVLVPGGNTLYAIRRWEETGLDKELVKQASRGAILAGGSAGAICWFSGGHSDSADPSTYLKAAVERLQQPPGVAPEPETNTSWSYIRAHGLGILPGLLCPHHDRTQSNLTPRATDFDAMLKRHATERGICIDHWAALILPGDGTFSVYATPGKSNANTQDGITPGVRVKEVVNRIVSTTPMPATGGAVSDLLREPRGPIVKDPFERFYAMENPTATTEKLLCRR